MLQSVMRGVLEADIQLHALKMRMRSIRRITGQTSLMPKQTMQEVQAHQPSRLLLYVMDRPLELNSIFSQYLCLGRKSATVHRTD